MLNQNRSSMKLKTNTYSSLVPNQAQVKALNKNAQTAKRRKDILMALGIAAVVTLVLAYFVGGFALWAINIIVDIALGSYIYLLIKLEEMRKARASGLNRLHNNKSNPL